MYNGIWSIIVDNLVWKEVNTDNFLHISFWARNAQVFFYRETTFDIILLSREDDWLLWILSKMEGSGTVVYETCHSVRIRVHK